MKPTEKQRIIIPMSDSDCEEVLRGEEFSWTFPDQHGTEIDVHIRLEVPSDIE